MPEGITPTISRLWRLMIHVIAGRPQLGCMVLLSAAARQTRFHEPKTRSVRTVTVTSLAAWTPFALRQRISSCFRIHVSRLSITGRDRFFPLTELTEMSILAIDLGKYKSVACHVHVAGCGGAVSNRGFGSAPLSQAHSSSPNPTCVVFETCTSAGWVADLVI